MARKYYTMLSRPRDNSAGWAIEFGDYSRNVVADEMRDHKESDRILYKRPEQPVYLIINHDDDKQLQAVAIVNKMHGYRGGYCS